MHPHITDWHACLSTVSKHPPFPLSFCTERGAAYTITAHHDHKHTSARPCFLLLRRARRSCRSGWRAACASATSTSRTPHTLMRKRARSTGRSRSRRSAARAAGRGAAQHRLRARGDGDDPPAAAGLGTARAASWALDARRGTACRPRPAPSGVVSHPSSTSCSRPARRRNPRLQSMRQVLAVRHIALSIVRNCAARAHCMFAAAGRQRAQRREALLTRGTALTFHPSTDSFLPGPPGGQAKAY